MALEGSLKIREVAKFESERLKTYTVLDRYENNSCRVSDRYGVRPALSSFLGGFHVNA